jgi:hypothetical protein
MPTAKKGFATKAQSHQASLKQNCNAKIERKISINKKTKTFTIQAMQYFIN